MKCGYTYVLKSSKDNHFYIGSTTDIQRRLYQHNSGLVQSTKNRKPLILIGYKICNTIQEAAFFEKKYKRSHDC